MQHVVCHMVERCSSVLFCLLLFFLFSGVVNVDPASKSFIIIIINSGTASLASWVDG